MSTSTSTARFRKWIGGLSLIFFPVAILIADLIATFDGDDANLAYETASSDPGALIASSTVLIASSLFLVVAVMAAAHLVRERGAALIHVGGTFSILGALGHVAIATFVLIVTQVAGGDRSEMVAFIERVNDSAALGVVFPLILSFGIGMLLLSIGLYRARVAPLWAMLAVIAAFVLNLGAPPSAPEALNLVEDGLLIVAYGWIGLRVLGMSLPDWEEGAIASQDAPVGLDAVIA